MKKTLTTISMAIVLLLGATFANAGIIVSDKATSSCSRDGIIVSDRAGIIVSDRAGIIVSDIAGIIVSDIFGIIVSDVKGGDPCRNGIIVSDAPNAGIIVSD